MWNQIFLGSYISLFVAIPFAYFFTESEGFAGSRKVNLLNIPLVSSPFPLPQMALSNIPHLAQDLDRDYLMNWRFNDSLVKQVLVSKFLGAKIGRNLY